MNILSETDGNETSIHLAQDRALSLIQQPFKAVIIAVEVFSV